MSSSPQGEASRGINDPPLEDRLRGLILNNSQPIPPSEPPVEAATIPPGHGGFHRRQLSSQISPERTQSNQASQGGRRRPNQAQRRQMNAQISIPIDPRIAPSETQRGRGFSSPIGPHWQTRPRGPLVGQQTGILSSPQRFPAQSQGPQLAGFNSLQSRPQTLQYVAPVSSQGQVIPQPGHAPQLPRATHENLPPISFSSGTTETNSVLLPDQNIVRPPPQHNRLYQPGPYHSRGYVNPPAINLEQLASQSYFLDDLLEQTIPKINVGSEEALEKEHFRARVEQICREAILNYEIGVKDNLQFNATSVELKCFGSMASGFATKASDMDLALLTPHSKPLPDSPESVIPRLLEKKLLDVGFGARLLTRTRVPIIKLCQNPTARLMSDLLDERKKWENSFMNKDAVGGEHSLPGSKDSCEVRGKVPKEALSEDISKLSRVTYVEDLVSLHQKPNQSLIDYYGSANRLLRKYETSDHIGSCEILPEQTMIVHEVCKAFIVGLSDKNLAARLLKYKSLLFGDEMESVKPRSLRGVFNQIEGEQWAMAWGNRPLREASEKLEADAQRQIDDWRQLLDVTTIDPMVYNGLLQNAASRLKKIASLQLLFLEQGLHETPAQYYLRAAEILGRLRSQNDDHVLAVVIAHYMNGIRNPKIQEALHTMTSNNDMVSLPSLALQHRIVQLADDYDCALSKGIYSVEDREDVELYVQFLRSRSADYATQVSKGLSEHILIENPTTRLSTKIRNLPDPSNTLQKPRDRYKDHLEFPKNDVGIQCDINFSAQLGLHNTLLLRCYSLTDSRVKPLILFVKYWARTRAVNTPYRGTLSSYGYVLMVLHYLINVTTPFVCPNLQHLQRDPPPYLPPDEVMNQTICNGYDVRFWRNEKEIANLAQRGMLNHNRDSPGRLLRGFFEYYAQSGPLTTGGRGFDWGRDVLSLRTMGGLLTKARKGWVGARTVTETRTEAAPTPAPPSTSPSEPLSVQNSVKLPADDGIGTPRKSVVKEEVKEVRHRFLFAIEDPFETDHNVARTVTHDGIVAIRDEFRRAWRIISNIGKKEVQEGLLDDVKSKSQPKSEFEELMDLLHGKKEDDERSRE